MTRAPTGLKTIILNGVAVGEFVSTGDFEKDASVIRKYLKGKGLHKEDNLVQAMFRQARSFATTASYLYKNGLTTSPSNVTDIAPFVVNSAFSIELYLKTLAQGHGKTLKGHELLKLYDALPGAALVAIHAEIPACAANRRLNEAPDLRRYVHDLNDTFVEWRYSYEKERTKAVHIEPTIFVMECLNNACKPLLEVA